MKQWYAPYASLCSYSELFMFIVTVVVDGLRSTAKQLSINTNHVDNIPITVILCIIKLDNQYPWLLSLLVHDDVTKWKHFPRYWPIVEGDHRSLVVDSPQTDQWRRALVFYLICAWTNSSVNNRDDGDLGRHCAHYDVTVMTRGVDTIAGNCCFSFVQ